MTDTALDYVNLVRRYETDLVDNLRGFGFQTDYLDLWVPDEDISRSLLNLLDAAATAGRDRLTVRLPADLAAQLRRSDFASQAASRCNCTLADENGGLLLTFDNVHLPSLGTSVAALPVGQARQAEIRPATATAVHQDPVRQPARIGQIYMGAIQALAAASVPATLTPAGHTLVSASCDGLTVQATVSADHVVQAIACDGARTATAKGLVAAMAQMLPGLPIIEIANHAAIRLEHRLRGEATPPVSGIAIPEASDPAFALVTHLSRELLADYRKKTGYSEWRNLFDATPGAAWMKADDAQRRSMLLAALTRDGVSPQDVSIIAIEYDVRVVISLHNDLASHPADHMLALERSIKRHVDSRLELFLAEVKDHNKIRRLSESGA
jgi:hypothetical protein